MTFLLLVLQAQETQVADAALEVFLVFLGTSHDSDQVAGNPLTA